MKPAAILVYVGALTVFLAVSVAGQDDVEMEGRYGLKTDPDNADLNKYMQVMEVNELAQRAVRSCKKLLVIMRKVNETHCQVKKISKILTFEQTFIPGKEFEAKLPDGRKKMTTITVDKPKLTAHRVIKMDGFESTHEAIFSKEGFTITMKAKDAVAKLEFKRLDLKAPKDDDAAAKKEYFAESK